MLTGSLRDTSRAAVTRPGLALITIALAAAALTACSSGASSGSYSGAASPPSASAASSASAAAGSVHAAPATNTGGEAQADSASRFVPVDPQLIYTAQLTVRAANVAAALSRATSIVTAAGGYVSAENSSGGNGQTASAASASVTLKIPAADYPATLGKLTGTGLGTQLDLSQQAQDVTQQVADVSSRVASDEAAITQLRALLKKAGDVEGLLDVQDQINSEESDLESMLAQQQSLDHETAYATVTLTVLGPKAPVKAKHKPKPVPPPNLVGGLAGGWRAFKLTIDWLLAIVGAVAPFAAVAVVIGLAVWWARRRLGRGPQSGRGARGAPGARPAGGSD